MVEVSGSKTKIFFFIFAGVVSALPPSLPARLGPVQGLLESDPEVTVRTPMAELVPSLKVFLSQVGVGLFVLFLKYLK